MPLVDDLGSGALLELARRADGARVARRRRRPRLLQRRQAARRPTGRIVVGRAELVERLRRHPLHRALRIDKLSLAALEARCSSTSTRSGRCATCRCCGCCTRTPRAFARAPSASPRRVGGEVEETVARVGGGALPLAELPSFACAVEEALAGPLRAGEPPVVGIVRDGRLLLDCRTLPDDEVDEVAAGRRGRAMPLTVGTAGHIDHGKTWLVRALTGKDTDRLPEEQARGISIDLGYAPLELPDGRRLSLVDVPGHERFVRTMVAGATGIDLFLLVIDAREGARPQTLRASRGSAAARRRRGRRRGHEGGRGRRGDPRARAGGGAGARARTPRSSPSRAKTGAGLDELRAALAAVAGRASATPRPRPACRSIASSRSAGIGTSRPGRCGRARSPRATCSALEPAAGTARVRSVQVHDRRSTGRRRGSASPSTCRRSTGASSRAATCSSSPAITPVSYRLDVRLEELEASRRR